MRIRSYAILSMLGAIIWSAALCGQPPATKHVRTTGIDLYPTEMIKWHEGPPSLPTGALIAVLEGDPTKEGPFVFRLKLPNGYRVPPHTHPKTERVTVISGTFNIGMGKEFDQKATMAMPAGTYGYWQAGMAHFVWVKGETVVQFHGWGPWSIEYINPRDDPRQSSKD
jgi:hypothetical protein